jgi:hypothetical protein
MQSEQGAKVAAKIEEKLEIHAFKAAGEDTPPSNEIFEEWPSMEDDPNHFLNKLVTNSAKTKVGCVRVHIDSSKPFGKQRSIQDCLHVTVLEAIDWLKLGRKAPYFNTEGQVNQIRSEVAAATPGIDHSNSSDEVELLKEQNKLLVERLDKLEQGEAKKTTPAKGDKK